MRCVGGGAYGGVQPRVNHNEWRLLYFISFLLLVGFFVLNMFVGVVVENFHKCQERQENEERLRRETARLERLQLRWKRTISFSAHRQLLDFTCGLLSSVIFVVFVITVILPSVL